MAKEHPITVDGVVLRCLPQTKFVVELENNHQMTASLSGKMRQASIKVTEGDKVKVEMSPYDFQNGRIVWRG